MSGHKSWGIIKHKVRYVTNQEDCAGFDRVGDVIGINVGEECPFKATHWSPFPLCDDHYAAYKRYQVKAQGRKDDE